MNGLTHVEPILKAARKTIERADRWTVGFMARDGEGAPCSSAAPEARCWCLVGAVNRATEDLDISPAFRDAVYRRLCEELNRMEPSGEWRAGERATVEFIRGALTAFNDHRTHDQVLTLLDRAIEGEAA